MVDLLLSLGARPDPVDRRQNTPLHLAVCTSRWAVTQKLLAAGANVWTVRRGELWGEVERGGVTLPPWGQCGVLGLWWPW